MKILVINPGSTSTKVAVFENEKQIFVQSTRHDNETLKPFKDISYQYPFRKAVVEEMLNAAGIPLQFDAIIGRGGLAKAIEGGVYEVNERMMDDARNDKRKHASDLGCIIAHEMSKHMVGCRSFIADPGVVDELCDEARISGSPLLPRICIWHALNQRAIARRFAQEQGCRYEDLNLIVCHLGGGISIAAHQHGRAIDANNALDGEGTFSPVRAGTLPAGDLIRLCFSGKYTEEQMLKYISEEAGLSAHLGTHDMKVVLDRISQGDKHAERVVNAMIYHTAKNIAAEGAVLCGKTDAILLTGGMAHSDYIIDRLKQRISFLAPVYVYPGEDEMQALALNALSVLNGTCEAKTYE